MIEQEQQVEIPVHDNSIRTYRSLDPQHPDNIQLLNKDYEKKYKELLNEVKVRFDTNPKFYQREDYQKLIELLDESGAASVKEDDLRTIGGESLVGEGDVDFKTINGETITGEGNIEIIGQQLTAGNALEIDQDDVLNVTSHKYDEVLDTCTFGDGNVIESMNSVAFGSNNKILATRPEGQMEFIGYSHINDSLYYDIHHRYEEYLADPYAFYLQYNDYIFDKENLEFYPGSNEECMFQYSLQLETGEIEHAETPIPDITNFIGSKIYLDDEGTEYLGRVVNAARCTDPYYYEKRIYFSVDNKDITAFINHGEDAPRSIWRKAPAGGSEHSLAEGTNNTIKGFGAHVEGDHNEAWGNYSHAQGQGTIAKYTGSFAGGCAYPGSSYIKTDGNGAFAHGFVGDDEDAYILSDGDGSAVIAGAIYGEDSSIRSESEGSVAFGNVECSHSEIVAGSDGSFAGGCVNGEYSSIETTCEGAFAYGYVSDDTSHIKAKGSGAQAMGVARDGNDIIASGEGSHAEGISTRADASAAHAEGELTGAYATASHVEGSENIDQGMTETATLYITEFNTTTSRGYLLINASGDGQPIKNKGFKLSTENHSFVALSLNHDVYEVENNKIRYECVVSNREGRVFAVDDSFEITVYVSFGAWGSSSHVEGTYCGAYGSDGAHAEGNYAEAVGNASHAEGSETHAYGNYSHAEGEYAIAFGQGSHAEGSNTLALGEYSNASGYETEALGNNSHAEGSYTVSTGEASHAEGYYTSAYGSSSHAEGEGGNISLFKSATEGDELDGFDFTTMSSDSDSDSAVNFFAGSDFYSDSDIDGILNVYGVEKQNKLAGWIGRPIYKADGSLLAIITDINGSHISVDRHVNVTINQPIYIKTGSTGEDAHAEGYLSDASGTHSHAEGERTLATGTNAHSEGYHSKAFGMNSHAEGDTTQALAASSHAEGRKTHTEGEYSHAEGYDTKASGMYSHAEGVRSDAEEEGSHAEGRNTSANGRYAHAEGYYSNAHGDYSHAEGNNTHTEFIGAHAEGYETDAHKDYSHAEGWKTITEGTASHAEGVETQAYGHYSHAEGIKTQTNNDGEHAQGKCNTSHRNSDIFGNPGNTIFSIGIGNEDRQNAIEIMQNGDIYIKNLAGFNGEDLNNADTLQRHITSSFIVIAAALNDLNNRINELSES